MSYAPIYSFSRSDAAVPCDICGVFVGASGFANHRGRCSRRSGSSSGSRPLVRTVPGATEADCHGRYQCGVCGDTMLDYQSYEDHECAKRHGYDGGGAGSLLRSESASPSELGGAAHDSGGVVNKYENMHIQCRGTELAENVRLELEIARFCLKHSLAELAGQDLLDILESRRPDGAVKLLGYRSILIHLRDDSSPYYPDARMYKFNRELRIDVPAGYNGHKASTVVFRCADPMDIIVSILLNDNLHGGKEANIRWGPTYPTTKSGERVFDSHLFSGDWARRTAATLPKGTDLLAVILSSDGVLLTGSGTQKAHPVMLSIGKLWQEPNLVLTRRMTG